MSLRVRRGFVLETFFLEVAMRWFNNHDMKIKASRRHLPQTILAAAVLGAGAQFAAAQLYWDGQSSGGPNGGNGTWNDTLNDWWNGSADVAWNGSAANFGATAGTVNVASGVSATSLNFNTTGYIVTFASGGSITTASVNVASGIDDIIGTNASATGGLNFTNGLTIGGGGELILAQKLLGTSGVTVNNSILTLGDRTLGTGTANDPHTYLNNNALTLNSSTLQIASQNTQTANAQSIASLMVSGTSTIEMSRTNTANSASLNVTSTPVTLTAGSTLIGTAGGNTEMTSTGFPYIALGTVTLNGPATLQTNSGTTAANNPFVENLRLGNITDNGNTLTFLGQGTGTQTDGTILLYQDSSYNGSGAWTIGNSNQTGTNGSDAQAVAVELFQKTGDTTGHMTTGNITVNNYSQLFFDGGADQTQWGTASQMITINGAGTSSTIGTGGTGASGALNFTNSAAGYTNVLNSNVALGSSASIDVNLVSSSATIADITGNISGPSTALLSKVGGGTLILDGANNTWSGGINIGNGIVQVGSGSMLGPGPVIMASNGSATSPQLIFNNANQTIGNLSSTFGSTSAATNTITLNGTALNIVQTADTVYGSTNNAGQNSVITGSGSLSIDASSTAGLTLSSANNNYSGPTNINGGKLFIASGASLTGGGAITVGDGVHAAIFGGSGSASGPLTVNNAGVISPGTATVPVGTLSLSGGLTLNNGSDLAFDLNTPGASDLIAEIGNLNLNGSITLTLNNAGALNSGGTFQLITYTGSGPALGANSNFVVNGPSGLGYSISVVAIAGGDAVDLTVAGTSATLYWATGNGSWDTNAANTVWKNGSSSGAATAFKNGDSAVFDDSASSSSPINVTLNSEVDPQQTTFNNSSREYIVSGSGFIGGTGGLLVSGSGTVMLNNTGANTFTGGVTLNGGGRLIVAADSALGGGSVVNISNGSTLEFNGNASDSRNFTLGGGGASIDVTSGNTATLSGSLTGSGGLTKTDSGTLLISGGTALNTYTGNTLVSGGTLQIGASGSIPSNSQVTIQSGATLDLQNFTDIVSGVSLSSGGTININSGGTLNVAGSNASTFAGVITGGSGTITDNSSATFDLSQLNSASAYGNLNITGGGTVFGGQGQLGSGTISLTGANSILQFSSDDNSPGQTLKSNTAGATVDLNGHNVTLGILTGTGVANIIGNGSLTFAGNGGTAAGVTIGNGGNTTVIVNNVNGTTGLSGIGSGAITVNSGATFEIQNAAVGYTSTGGVGTPLTTITFNGNSTFAGTGTAEYVGSTSPVIGNGANVTFTAPGASDLLIVGSAVRNSSPGGSQDTSNSITITGSGTVQIASGATSATAGTQYGGVWTVNSGTLLFEPTAGATGEVLNGPGYLKGANYAATSTITLNAGTIAFGADMNNPVEGATSTLNGLNSFRSPLYINGGALASAGFEYNAAASTNGAVFDSTPVTANIDGDLNINGGATLTVDTYDPIAGEGNGARDINFATDSVDVDFANPDDPNNEVPIVTGNINWGGNSQLVTNSGGYAGGALNIARVAFNLYGNLGSVVTYNSGASLTVNYATSVNVGKTLPPGTGSVLTTVANAIDPFTDSNVYNNPTSSDTTHSLSADVYGTLDYAARTGGTDITGVADTGIKIYRLSALGIEAGGKVMLDDAANNGDPNAHADRTLLVLGSLNFGSPLLSIANPDIRVANGGLDITDNDVLVHNGSLTGLTTQLQAGLNYVSGIYSSVASLANGTAVGIVDPTYYGFGDAAPPTTFDGMGLASSDVLIKYTYLGDLNLDGVVNSADLAMMDKVPTTGVDAGVISWFDGDLNYDGKINQDDYALFMLGNARQGASLASVPEPAMISLLALPLLAGLRRRRI